MTSTNGRQTPGEAQRTLQDPFPCQLRYSAALPSPKRPVLAASSSRLPLFSLQWQREAGILDVHTGVCGDDVPGRWAGVGQHSAPQEKPSEPFVQRRLELDMHYPLDFFVVHKVFLDPVWC